MLVRERFFFLLLPLLIASIGAVSCSSSVKGTGGGATTGGNGGNGGNGAGGAPAACPADTPSNASACAGVADGTACDYPTPCCQDTIATCEGGHWDVQGGACEGLLPKPPPPSCPPQQPAE